MRMLSLCILVLTLLTGTTARAEEFEDYGRVLKTFQGTMGSDPIIVELAFPRRKDSIVGRFTFPSIGKDIPLHSIDDVNGQSSAGSTITIVEEAPCSPKTCESIVPERDDESLDFAPGEAPQAAKWTLEIDKDGLSVSGARKDLKTGETKSLSLTFVTATAIEDDCCTTFTLLPGNLTIEDLQREVSYDTLRFGIPFKKGPSKNLGEATYHMETDERINADFPIVEKLPGNVDFTLANQWLRAARIELYSRDFACAARQYHGFRWNKAMAKKLENYKTKSKADIDFISEKLIGIAETINEDCGDAYEWDRRAYYLFDVKTGKKVDIKPLLEGFQFQDDSGKVVDLTDPYGKFRPKPEFIDQITTAVAEAGGDDSCLDEDSLRQLTAAFRGDTLAFTFDTSVYGLSPECDKDILTIPLADAGEYLNDQGKAYFSEFLN